MYDKSAYSYYNNKIKRLSAVMKLIKCIPKHNK